MSANRTARRIRCDDGGERHSEDKRLNESHAKLFACQDADLLLGGDPSRQPPHAHVHVRKAAQPSIAPTLGCARAQSRPPPQRRSSSTTYVSSGIRELGDRQRLGNVLDRVIAIPSRRKRPTSSRRGTVHSAFVYTGTRNSSRLGEAELTTFRGELDSPVEVLENVRGEHDHVEVALGDPFDGVRLDRTADPDAGTGTAPNRQVAPIMIDRGQLPWHPRTGR